MIVIDTDILIEIIDKHSKLGSVAFDRIIKSGEDFFITAINLHEIMYGLLKYSRPLNDIVQLPVLNYTKTDAELSSELELKAERKGKRLLRTDAMIAAITINNNGKLYTNNIKHFKDFENLELYDILLGLKP